MKNLAKPFLLTVMTATALAVVPVLPASAAVTDQHVMVISDTCGMVVANDTAPAAPLGGPDAWTGAVFLNFAQASGTTPHAISAYCELLVNGVTQGIVLGPASGIDAVAAAGRLAFTAAVTDIATLCAHVTVDAVALPVTCRDATTSQVVPQPVFGLVCLVLVVAAPTVDAIFNPGFLYIDPVTGDLYVGGTLLYDC